MKHFIKYNLIGVLNTLITLCIVWVLSRFGLNPYLTNALGFIAGGINSYFMNKYLNFKSTGSHKQEAVWFIMAFGAGYTVNLGVLHFCLHYWSFPAFLAGLFSVFPSLHFNAEFISNIIANGVYVVVTFMMMKFWVFGRKNSAADS